MDFESIRIEPFLEASVPARFQDVSPFDFEDFVAHLFYEAGYEVEQTDYTGDFGADMIIGMDGKRTVVQVKRYQSGASVGVHDLNQVVAAQKFYQADQAMIVATTSFTSSARKVAVQAEVVLWDWDRLLHEIEEVFLGGKDFYTFFREAGVAEPEREKQLRISPKEFDVFEHEKFHALIFELENDSSQNILCRLELPVVLTKDRRQVQAVEWMEGYFSGGHIYSGARVEVGCLFLTAQIDGIEKGDRLIQRVYFSENNTSRIVEAFLAGEKEGCGLVLLALLFLVFSFAFV